MNIQEVYEIFHQLETNGAKTAKEEILKQHEGNEDFRKALVFLLNPYVVTGLSTKKINKKVKNQEVLIDIGSLDSLITYLSTRNSGRDFDIANIQHFINSLDSDELKTFVRKFVTKSLKVGITSKTVNKVYGKDTVPSFSVMLAESFAKKEKKITGKFFVTLKLDGNRCLAVKEDGQTKFFTRSGQQIEGMVDLEEHFEALPDGWVFDGEILLKNEDNLPSKELFTATQKVVRKDGEKKNLEFYMFDMLPLTEFKDGTSKNTYEKRRKQLDLLDEQIIEESEYIYTLPVLYEGKDKSIIPNIMSKVTAEGFEGLMINSADGLYQAKRTVDLQKVKEFKTADLLVMSAERAIDGQFEGLLSRVNVEYKGNLVGVGSGFTLEDRHNYIECPDLIVGKIIEVQFFEESKDEKTGLPSMRFPTFKGIRHDKTVEDINYGE
ncbi:ATP-dependent DNA ligase [Halobacillus rhizosphaerae]|uniref:ATP-dependent DNA ligase n=1 Tax=Halobacillus rhizosphaerae TaxID=3064889 RepID=UPI00398B8EDD